MRSDRCGLGWCLRNSEGQFVAGASKPCPGVLTALGAELVSIREALSWLKEYGITSPEIESDAVGAVTEIQEVSSCSLVGLLRDDIRDLTDSFSFISFCHVRRSANKPAHLLAREACSLSDMQLWVDFPPDFIVSAFANDLININ
ncbi:unnamed protein product [Cuscuta epithymum]|uniref:RNase H type-1 domain-containing protein n=1 Tax=Cuscuta epithymum TaxID=186058 RepID=A0AAV0G1Q5_9ASTE|nr:unnamed protein product [Cuscuta epithymum]